MSDEAKTMSKLEKAQRLMLLDDGLVSIVDPLDNVTKQVSVEAAKRYAKVNSDVKWILDQLGVDLTPAPTEEVAVETPEVTE